MGINPGASAIGVIVIQAVVGKPTADRIIPEIVTQKITIGVIGVRKVSIIGVTPAGSGVMTEGVEIGVKIGVTPGVSAATTKTETTTATPTETSKIIQNPMIRQLHLPLSNSFNKGADLKSINNLIRVNPVGVEAVIGVTVGVIKGPQVTVISVNGQIVHITNHNKYSVVIIIKKHFILLRPRSTK